MNSKKMSILRVSFTILDASLTRMALLQILIQISELGYDVSLIATRSKTAPRAENPTVRIISIPLRYVPVISHAMLTIVLFFFLPVYVIKLKPDYIIAEPSLHILSFLPGILVSKFKNAKFVLDIRSTPVETGGLQGFLRKFWFSVSLLIAKKLFDGMTIITPLMKKEVCNNFNLNPEKVGVWTSGVSQDLFNPQNIALEAAESKRKLGLTGKFVVFYHGVFSATRGLQETIDAIEILKYKHPNIVLFLLGDGPIASMLKTLVLEKNLQDSVIIHNTVEPSNVPKFIGICDVGIVPLPYNPYWRFQSPLKLLEYLSMEKVVVVSDIPAHRFVVGDKECAIYISSVEPVEIAKSIEYAYNNRDKLAEWGKIGRAIIKQEYTWEKVARDLENYLSSINYRAN